MKVRVLLVISDSEGSPPLSPELGGYGLEIEEAPLGAKTSSCPRASAVFLVHSKPGLVKLGERVGDLRQLLGRGTRLVACTPRPPSFDAIRRSGADDLITPRSWSPPAVAERILGELIVRDGVEPVRFGLLRGGTLAMRQVYDDIKVQAPLSDPVLVLGESGTGKELVSRELHDRSGRGGQCLALNCAALTTELLESELFGHERGAFTGADSARKGLALEAGEGTLFLDEIGELTPAAQAKLLRVIDERKVRPVGSNRWLPFQARIVLATNRDLEKEVAEGRFRRDLYERVRGFQVQLPPLRKRRADIPLLARHFVAEFEEERGGSRQIPSSTMDLLFRHDWPGNVRELRQVMRQASAFATDPGGAVDSSRLQEALQMRTNNLPAHVIPFDPAVDTWKKLQGRARDQYIRSVLEQTGGERTAAAKLAGISRARFYELLKEIDIEKMGS